MGDEDTDTAESWHLMRVTSPRPEVGLPMEFTWVRELTPTEHTEFLEAIDVLGAFGPSWGHNRLVAAAAVVADALGQLADNAKAAEGRLNSHDLDRVRWSLTEVAGLAADRITAAADKGGRCTEAVAAAAAHRFAKWCQQVADGTALALVAGLDSDQQVVVGVAEIDGLSPTQVIGAMEVVSGVLMFCTPISDAELLDAEADLEAASKVLMAAVAQVLWGRPVLAPIPTPGDDASISLTQTQLPLEMIGYVLGACRLAHTRTDPPPPGTPMPVPVAPPTDEPAASTGPTPTIKAGPDEPGLIEGVAGAGDTEAIQELNTIPPVVDLAALAREAAALGTETEKAWSDALALVRGQAVADITARGASLLNALYREMHTQEATDVAAGHSTGLPGVPTPPAAANLFEQHPTGQQGVTQHALATALAAEDLIHAMSGLREPDRTNLNLVDGTERSWWSHEGFMRVRRAAEVAVRVVTGTPPGDEYERGVQMTLAYNAWDAGLPEAALVHFAASLEPGLATGPVAGVHALTRSLAAAIGNGEAVSLDAVIPVMRFWFDHMQFQRELVVN